MPNARIDENTHQVGLGLVQGSIDTKSFAINTSNELLIEIIPVADIGTLAFTPENIRLDENTRQIAAGVSNDSNQDIIPLTVDLVIDLPCVRVEVL